MPDDRFIHPRLGHNDKVHQLSWFERCVWITYLLAADDFGVMRYSAVTIREADDKISEVPERKVKHALDRICELGLIKTFSCDRRVYCFHPEWQNYQRVRRPRGTLNPAPPQAMIDGCTQATRALFGQHPSLLTATFPQPDGKIAETTPPNIGNVATDGPPAVSRVPLAVSRVPLAGDQPQAQGGTAPDPDHPTRAQLRSMGTLVAPVNAHVYRHGPVDVTQKTHAQLRQKAALRLRGKDDVALDQFLDAFYDATEARWQAAAGAPAGKSWEIWFAAYDAAYAVAAPTAGTQKTAGNVGVVQRFIERGQRV
jgi:hypothetical protein